MAIVPEVRSYTTDVLLPRIHAGLELELQKRARLDAEKHCLALDQQVVSLKIAISQLLNYIKLLEEVVCPEGVPPIKPS